MRHVLLIAACCTLLLSCGGPKGNIIGHVRVAAGHPDMGVFVVLWQLPAAPLDPDDPQSPLIPTVGRSQMMSEATMLGQIAVGVTDEEERNFKYNLYSLDRGLYVVGAYLDTNQDPNRNMLADVHVIDSGSPIEVWPGIADLTTVTRDLYLGKSAPEKGTISGVIHMSERATKSPSTVIAFDGNPFMSADASIIAQTQVNGALDAPFTLFNVPLSEDGSAREIYVTAVSDANSDGNIGFYSDRVAVLRGNPLYLMPDAREVTDLELWMDRQAPNLGSLTGVIEFSSRLAVAATTLLAFSNDPTKNANANVVGVVNGSGIEAVTIPFVMPSLPLGKIWLVDLLQTAGAYEPIVSAQYQYGLGRMGMTPIAIPAESPHVSEFRFPVGVGRVSGAIDLARAETPVSWAWVFVNEAGTTNLVRYDTITFESGAQLTPYELFGLKDGVYDVYLQTDAGKSMDGSPRTVVITGGSREGSDFRL